MLLETSSFSTMVPPVLGEIVPLSEQAEESRFTRFFYENCDLKLARDSNMDVGDIWFLSI